MKIRDQWVWVLLPAMILTLYVNLLWSPDDAVLGPSQRIFYVHMGAATVAMVAYTITFVASVGYLWTRRLGFDIWAAVSAELGTLFTTVLLITGILWGRAAWGVWWTWDPRLTATLILWVLFMAYMLLREWSDGRERRARYAAVLAILAYLDVPLDYMTIRWWKSIHPVVITASGIHMAPRMIIAMFLSMAVWGLLLAAWMAIRLHMMRAEVGMEAVKHVMRSEVERGDMP